MVTICSLVAIRYRLGTDLLHRQYALLVASRLDYYNAVLTGFPKCSLGPLQPDLNKAVRLGYKAKRLSRASPV